MVETTRPPLSFEVDGKPVEVPDDGANLLTVLRERLGLHSAKDGCSPQGQCGCCTVLVDGRARVACVTPARRVRGRSVTTLDGLGPDRRQAWGQAFCDAGASQCGFCTPGIILRLEALAAKGGDLTDPAPVEQALLAHLCRCTGWRTILDAAGAVGGAVAPPGTPPDAVGVQLRARGADRDRPEGRDLEAAGRRATIEGRSPQRVSPEVALGQGGFADDTAPADCLVAVPDGTGGWAVGESLAAARAASGKVQGRRTTVDVSHPIEVPPGDWDVSLRTTWVEAAYLEVDASWCAPGGEPATPLANGGAFGGKVASPATAAARELADRHGRPVRVVLAREDVVRLGPKRPPLAAGIRADGSGAVRVARTPGIAAAIASVAPELVVEEVDVAGPPTSADLRAAGWAEALALLAAAGARTGAPLSPDAPSPLAGEGGAGLLAVSVDPLPTTGDGAATGPGSAGHAATGRGATASGGSDRSPAGPGPVATVALRSPDGAVAEARLSLGDTPRVSLRVACGDPLDEVVLRSYCVGAAHMALGWVTSEGLAVDTEGRAHDLTIRSFGILRAVDTPPIDVDVTVEPGDGPPVNGSDAVFAAVAAAAWLAKCTPPAWPTG